MLLENPVHVPPMACGIMSAGCLRGLDDVMFTRPSPLPTRCLQQHSYSRRDGNRPHSEQRGDDPPDVRGRGLFGLPIACHLPQPGLRPDPTGRRLVQTQQRVALLCTREA